LSFIWEERRFCQFPSPQLSVSFHPHIFLPVSIRAPFLSVSIPSPFCQFPSAHLFCQFPSPQLSVSFHPHNFLSVSIPTPLFPAPNSAVRCVGCISCWHVLCTRKHSCFFWESTHGPSVVQYVALSLY